MNLAISTNNPRKHPFTFYRLHLVNSPEQNTPFGNVIFTYTRAQALADGEQVDVSTTASEAGIRFPVYLTRSVFDQFVTIPPGVECQDEAGRLWDIVWMLRFAIQWAKPGVSRMPVALQVRNTNGTPKPVRLIAVCGPRDLDDPQPAITVMLEDED